MGHPSAAAVSAELSAKALALGEPLPRPSPRRCVATALIFSAAWVVFSWLLCDRSVDRQVAESLSEANASALRGATEIATGLGRSLSVYRGIPTMLARDRAVREALVAFPSLRAKPGDIVGGLPARWRVHPAYGQLNRSLADTVRDIPAFSAIWVVDADGGAIAASNADADESFVGYQFGDRDYFLAARAGQNGSQFAVGRVSRIPGLYFSSPVRDGARFLGAVVVKIDLPFLDFWVNQADAFLTDTYGVIVLARDKPLEMRALASGSVRSLTPDQRMARYQRGALPELSVVPWGRPPHPTLRQLGNDPMPVVMVERPVPEEDLTVTVMGPLPIALDATGQRTGAFASMASLGVLSIVVLSALSFFVINRRQARYNREHQAQVEYLATHDALTGLYNRATIEQVIPHGIALAERTGRPLAVMFLDLDFFKTINDSMGHVVGDDVLREVARRLRREVRAVDALIRHGGDEFLIVLNDLDSALDAARVARKLIDAVSEPYAIREASLKLSASVGIAVYPGDGDTAAMLVRNADSALYHAKEAGRADFCFYHASMNADSMARIALGNALRLAVDNDELELLYQPQCELKSRRIVACEALVCWHHPIEGVLAPSAFIPIAEKSGMIVQIDAWVLGEACRQMQRWRTALGVNIRVAVNISALHFRKPGLVERVKKALDASGLPPCALELELTESAIMEDPLRAAETLAELKALGVSLAIDDFGTGYSSLAYLKRFSANAVKIDRAFICDIAEDVADRAIVAAIAQLVSSLGCVAIAEGVETELQAALLDQLGCDLAQGFWFSRPLSAEGFAGFVAEYSAGKGCQTERN